MATFSFFGVSRYNFEWSEDGVSPEIICVPAPSSPFTLVDDDGTGTSEAIHRLELTDGEPVGTQGLLTLTLMCNRLLYHPEMFSQSGLELVGLMKATEKLKVIEASTTTVRDVQIDGEFAVNVFPGFFVQKIQPSKNWRRNRVIATLSARSNDGPCRDLTIDSAFLVFQLENNNTITVFTRSEKLKMVWHDLIDQYRLGRPKNQDFNLIDLLCFCQLDSQRHNPSLENHALVTTIVDVAKASLHRLSEPDFFLLQDRNPILQNEREVLDLCLRREWQRHMMYLVWMSSRAPRHLFCEARIVEVMTTADRKKVDFVFGYMSAGRWIKRKLEVSRVVDLDVEGIFFVDEPLAA